MKIKIYAPLDCTIKNIRKCKDGAFSSLSLGNGFLIIPKEDEFYSMFENATVKSVFETNHAYLFNVNGIEFLLHCGLNTVNLSSNVFTSYIDNNNNQSLNDRIFKVDIKQLKKENFSVETPFVYEGSYEMEGFEEKDYKRGELITIVNVPFTNRLIKDEKIEEDLEGYESKFLKLAKEINELVGTKENYDKVYNCVTRVRFKILDKKKVKYEELKKLLNIKGVNWAGNELQVIVGGESGLVKKEIKKLNNGDYSNIDFKKNNKDKKFSISSALSGILVPCLPLLTASGLLFALYSILTQSKAIPSDPQENMFGFLMYISSITGLSLVGIFLCYNTTKYFGGNVYIAILIGLILTSRLYSFVGTQVSSEMVDGAKSIKDIAFGTFINDIDRGINGWYLFRIGDYPVTIRAYEGSIIPFVAAGFILTKVDILTKKIVPKSLDFIFGTFLTMILTLIPMFFILGPLLSLVEYGISTAIIWMEKWPFGIGITIYGLLYQAIVLTGTHNIINMAVNISFLKGTPSLIFAVAGVAMYAQAGGCIGVILLTKNKVFKRNAGLTLAPLFLGGISEPLLYGVTIPKIKPFIASSLAAGITSFLIYYLDLKIDIPAGGGLFAIFGFIGIKKQLLILLMWTLSIGFAILFTILIYKEKLDEFKYSMKYNRLLKKILIKSNLKENEVSNVFNNLKEASNEIKNNKLLFKNYEKYLISLNCIDAKLEKIKFKEEKNKNKLYKSAIRAKKNKNLTVEDKNKIILKFKNYNLNNEKNVLELKKQNIILTSVDLKNKFDNFINKIFDKQKSILTSINESISFNKEKILNGFSNSLNSINLCYDLKTKLNDKFNFKKDWKM
ncbi:PTS glucose transporter subunit IIABC [Spiroplasma turonicum]|uniref:Beta-glucoside PTS system IIABC component n=1 Tax=Spiroplasma turonicum TaxID=216946 RepID=A0A0K1P6M3_9MOLU|nr:PTS glucose transporter subunit IIABC [Spiroplasma turonicum]AKU79859.1 beta-glucoside PTS system IIABC component [Spiroplasma turonicum]ALX70875.1 hypothetical protein STURO_v1c06120 [Spiroplasma turonicum]